MPLFGFRRTMLKFLFIILCFVKNFVPSSQNEEFDKGFVGVVFEPYTKHHNDRFDYSIEDVENMLQVVTKRFKFISTYATGTIGPSSKWDEGEAGGFSAAAASLVNSKARALQLVANVGAWYFIDTRITKQEISNAFSVAEVANKKFPGTVNGIIITSFRTKNIIQIKELVELLKANFHKARGASIQLGIRVNNCGLLSSSLTDNLTSQMFGYLNFTICHRLPSFTSEDVSTQVRLVGNHFLQVRKRFASFIKRNFTVIGETGWPSYDQLKGRYSSKKSVQFWLEMGNWAKINKFRVDMFSAFDEPWKVVYGDHQPHFGIWKRIKNDTSDSTAFQDKIDEGESINSTLTVVVLGILGSVVVFAILGGTLFVCMRPFLRSRTRIPPFLPQEKEPILSKVDIDEFEYGIPSDISSPSVGDHDKDALRVPYDRHNYEILRQRLQIDKSNLLGSGAFGCVYKGKLDGQNDGVAIKVPKSNGNGISVSLKRLLSEIKIMIHIGSHPNVLSLIGACTGEMTKGMVMIVAELCSGGTLEKRLRELKVRLSSEPSVSRNVDSIIYVNIPTQPAIDHDIIQNCIRWSYEIAYGMEHIASKNVIHADLATRNVLLTANGTAKIIDFGLSRHLYEYTNYVIQSQEPLPWRWMAIESLKTLTFSTKSDVWSFGVTLFEIFSLGDTPYPGLSWTVDFANNLEKGMRMNKPSFATTEIYSTMSDCWKRVPAERPSFSDLARFFHGLLYNSPKDLGYENLAQV